MARKALLSKCDTCREPKPGTAYQRYANGDRHGSCRACEDAKPKSLWQQDVKAYQRAYYERMKEYRCIVATRWVGGKYPGAM